MSEVAEQSEANERSEWGEFEGGWQKRGRDLTPPFGTPPQKFVILRTPSIINLMLGSTKTRFWVAVLLGAKRQPNGKS